MWTDRPEHQAMASQHSASVANPIDPSRSGSEIRQPIGYAIKDLLRWVHSKSVFDRWFTSQQGVKLGPTAEWQNHPLWQTDPVMLPFRSLAEIGRAAGYAGPANRAAAEVVTKYIITDMYAKAVQGTPAEDAVKWAHGELSKIYS